MGTRGNWGINKNGVDKLTYNHFDSYPSCLGETVRKFVVEHEKELDEIFDRVILVNGDTKPTQAQKKELSKYKDLSVSTQSEDEWYCLLRNAQGEPETYAKGLCYMIDSKAFMQDSLFCEWAYVINLDKRVLEVYKGFQKTSQDNRYKMEKPDGEYWHVALIREFTFDELKAPNLMNDLEKELEG